jgi:hypothetical protein
VARGFTGSFAAGLMVFGVVLVGVQFWAARTGQGGPGMALVISHLVAGVVALMLQAVADRRADGVGALSALGSLAVVLGSLWFWWLF